MTIHSMPYTTEQSRKEFERIFAGPVKGRPLTAKEIRKLIKYMKKKAVNWDEYKRKLKKVIK